MAITDSEKRKRDEIQGMSGNSDGDHEEESEEESEEQLEDELEEELEEESEEDDDYESTEEESGDEPLAKQMRIWEPYSVAIKRNALRREQQIRSGEYIPEKHDPLKELGFIPKVLTAEEIEAKKKMAFDMSLEINACAVRIQEALNGGSKELDESTALEELKSFCAMPFTPLALTYSPIMLLTLKMCKSYTKNRQIQMAARNGYGHFSALFPFHITSSFEAVYIETVKKVSAEDEFGTELMEDIVEVLEEVLFLPVTLGHYDD